jgi:hypothetical protein
MARILMLAIVAMVLLADGYLCGHWSGRWGDSQKVAADSLEHLPLVIGEWQGEPLHLDPSIVKRAEFGGYLLRRYENQRTRTTVTMLLASGRPRPLGVHTPELCYAGAGFAQVGASTRGNVDSLTSETPAEFLQGKFARKNQVQTEELRVIWTWNKSGIWQCPDNPRWALIGVPVVYKLYVCQALMPGSEDGNTCVDFLRDVLPELDRALVHGR